MSKSTRSSRSAASTRSAATKAARRMFQETYGKTTANVVRLIAYGLDNPAIRAITGASVATIATYRANVTRGAYYPWVSGAFYGTCNYLRG